MEKSAIKDEILKKTGEEDDPYNTPKFRAGLIRAVSALPDDDWEKLSETAQEWSNTGVDAIEEGEQVPNFPDVVVVEDPPPPPPKPKPKKKSGEPKGRPGRKSQVPDDAVIRLLVSENPKRTNTTGYRQFAVFRDGMTVGEFRDEFDAKKETQGFNSSASAELRRCIKKAYIKLE